ncbi:hypothetical protein GLOIN_2v1886689 [Rhizophagus clarus]|uniref:Uncharacterized protein n=1 Tax=Rhizophagus clarus TaxID=94130 RepID=A0A8H3QNW7_9GLOM|nr:hypothetical protein GLOIN_2v1886689 [Rhizophagus clarus]
MYFGEVLLVCELQTEVDSNHQNEKQIRDLEREYARCERKIQTLNGEIERLENTSEEEIEKYVSDLEKRLEKSEEQVDRLQCRIRTISSQKNTPEWRNSPDLYNPNINLEMANITELANAIDGYMENRTTTRDILIDQIKRATRQVCRKENILHQALICEQRRRYYAKAERDLAITRRDLAEAAMGLLVYNQDRLYERYEKWKNKTHAKRQNILNLQEQIFALQNNPPNIQQIGIIGYGPPIFYGRPGEDPEDWLREMQRYIIASRINVAPGAGQAPRREEAFGLVVSCLAGNALNWYNTRVKGKNWRCNNLSDNLGVADLNAVRGLNAGNDGNQIGGLNTAGEFQGKAAAKIGRIGAGIATGADIIPNGTWDEDWSIAGGELVDNAPVAPNTGGSLPAVTIAPDIKLGDMSVEQFSARIKKVGKLAEMTPEQQREQFIRGLNPINQYNIRMMAKFYDTQNNITKALAEAEKYTLSQMNAPSSIPVFLAANPYVDTNRSGGGMTKNEIEDLIKTTMASSQPQQNTDLQAIAKSFQETISRTSKTLDNSKKLVNKRAEDHAIMRFLKDIARVRANEGLDEDYDYDPVDDITDNSSLIASKQIVPIQEKIVSQNNVSSSSKDSDESSLEEESLDGPMEIDFVQKKEPKTSVVTVECKIKRLKIPAMTLDSRAEPPIITKNIVDRVKAKIDKSEKHDFSGVATVPIESIGVTRNLPIALAPGLTIHEDFIVVDYHNQLLKKYKCAMDWDTNKLKISLNGKDYIILVTMHKVKNKLEVNCANVTPECDNSMVPDKNSQDLGADETLKKK